MHHSTGVDRYLLFVLHMLCFAECYHCVFVTATCVCRLQSHAAAFRENNDAQKVFRRDACRRRPRGHGRVILLLDADTSGPDWRVFVCLLFRC
jgi:hypothetical protein